MDVLKLNLNVDVPKFLDVPKFFLKLNRNVDVLKFSSIEKRRIVAFNALFMMWLVAGTYENIQ